MNPATIIIADDHPLFRAALKQAVEQCLDCPYITEADGMNQLEQAAADHADADLVLLDLHMPGARGFSSLIYLRSHYPAIPVVVVSASDEHQIIRRAIDFGAAGFIPKSASMEDISLGIGAVIAGDTSFPSVELDSNPADAELASKLESLTPQQFRVLVMLADGLLNKQIGYELAVSEATVKAHMTALMRKLGVFSRTQAALIAKQLDDAVAPVICAEAKSSGDPEPDADMAFDYA